ncbi:MAG: single-stranded-DNA-specific exonuclease RecJ [Atopobiaceae bacterium]|jgi:single-stranded-DNA-specific exonuclease|nr:single-stranded-DNA-specific exonuclease RecJ [Atopobiaceae bacterium]
MPSLLNNRRWEVLSCNGEDERLLCEQLGVAPLVARVLCARGIRDVASAKKFLHPSLDRDWADPLDIPGMREAADRVEEALRNHERIAVFGDFDVDGMTSTCLLTQALRKFGAMASPYIPHRFGEGYGLSHEALNRVIADSHPDLIITVDNGIASGKEVAWLVEQGLDVVVTDHHEPGDLVPQGVPVTDPKLSADCYSRELAGAGVALKLVCELGRRLGKPDLWREFTDLAALGTVSDMMILQGENRSLVANGMQLMRRSKRPGIIALAASAGVDLANVHADDLPFSLIPRLNAAGRMGSTDVAFDLLLCEEPQEAVTLAGMLERTNTERRETEGRLSEEALARLEMTYSGERVIVLAGEGWHEGVKGIVASRIVNRYHVPAIIFTIVDGVARGSGRSVGSVDLFHAVEQCSDVLVRFGGHAGAVGVTCEADRVDEFAKRLQQVMSELPEEEFVDKGEVSAIATLGELTLENIAALDVLQPFGQGNKRPLFGLRGVFMSNRARVGYEGSHLRFNATDGACTVPAIMFRAPKIEKAATYTGLVDLVVDAVNESWQGRTNPKLMVSDILYRDTPEPGSSVADDLFSSDAGDPEAAATPASANPDDTQSMRRVISDLPANKVLARLRKEFIGNHELLPAQREALERLERGASTLCVMATGRGKSLIFHLQAARLAICAHKASIFVFPLRALVSDQAFHTSEAFSKLGISVEVLTGETPESKRVDVYDGLEHGLVDVILTTPEYLAIHADKLARSKRVGLLVIDEAHHAGMTQAGNRVAYNELPRVRRLLGNPVCLAVTATASTKVSHAICALLDIDERDVVVDKTVRANLRIMDYRDLRERDALLTTIVATGKKTVVYVNSRDQAATIARNLRNAVPDLGQRIAFYHAGLSRSLRLKVERAFRDDRLCCIVSTSAFGEGVNLPGIRNVVLYHMPFGATEFNQMSGRAGRDGKEARIYLLFGRQDAQINRRILTSLAPVRDDLAVLYRELMTENRRANARAFTLDDATLLHNALSIDNRIHLTEAGVASGLCVFEELGFLSMEGYGERRTIRMMQTVGKVDLTSSLRYAEGQRELEEFAAFAQWALGTSSDDMLTRVNRPITPGFGFVVGS